MVHNIHTSVEPHYVCTCIRPHKLNSLFSVTTFYIFHAGGRSLFIIHCSFSSNLHATPLIKRVRFDDQPVMLRLKVKRGGINEVFSASLREFSSVPLEKK